MNLVGSGKKLIKETQNVFLLQILLFQLRLAAHRCRAISYTSVPGNAMLGISLLPLLCSAGAEYVP